MPRKISTFNFVSNDEVVRAIRAERRRIKKARPHRFASKSRAIRNLILRGAAATETPQPKPRSKNVVRDTHRRDPQYLGR